ncbi:MAG TPA: farnesyl diphosphate synthase [Bacillales bacterium]|nr:farnesyl diphosphate synthase [Bacillales bacterium]
MNDADLQSFLTTRKSKIDALLTENIERLNAPDRLKSAMLYSVQAGGKRIRPILLLAVMEAFGRDSAPGLQPACAIEMIHTYSLIHDDLPAMDDDDLRRGKPTNHKMFDEATAILAGDALLTYGFEIIAEAAEATVTDRMKTDLVAGLAKAAGAAGMVGGQMDDLIAEGQELSLHDLENIHLHKTGKLLSFSVEAGALLADADPSQRQGLKRFSEHLGLAFQIRDDILDVEGDSAEMGKTAGSDANKQKSTYPRLLTLSGAKQKCGDHLEKAKHYLHGVEIDHGKLEQMAEYIVYRNR